MELLILIIEFPRIQPPDYMVIMIQYYTKTQSSLVFQQVFSVPPFLYQSSPHNHVKNHTAVHKPSSPRTLLKLSIQA